MVSKIFHAKQFRQGSQVRCLYFHVSVYIGRCCVRDYTLPLLYLLVYNSRHGTNISLPFKRLKRLYTEEANQSLNELQGLLKGLRRGPVQGLLKGLRGGPVQGLPKGLRGGPVQGLLKGLRGGPVQGLLKGLR